MDDSGSISSSLDGGSSNADPVVSPTGSKLSQRKTRKAGFILLKRWLIPRDRDITMTGTDTWSQYWALLKGFNLHFYSVIPQSPLAMGLSASSSSSASPVEKEPPSSKVR